MSREPEKLLGSNLDDESWFRKLRALLGTDILARIGPYEVLAEVARGGQGVVYKARQPRTGRIIAIKRLAAGAFATPQMRARFEREVEAAAALDHPGIVTVFGCEIVDGQPVLAMQWVNGVPIDRWATEEWWQRDEEKAGAEAVADKGAREESAPRRRGVREVLELFIKVCDAVHHAHQRGVIHRDLKPSNILVVEPGIRSSRAEGSVEADQVSPIGLSAPEPKVLDFGLAKLHIKASPDAALTLTGDFLGTPAYAAPEQMRGDSTAVDVRTDVYALGAVLYQALTGRMLFEHSADVAEMLKAVCEKEPKLPSTLDSRLDGEIDAIVLKAVAKEKELRYPSVDALRADLQRYLAGEAVLAHPPSTSYRVRKFVRSHGGTVGAALAFIFLLVAAVATTTTLYFRSEQARNAAESARLAEANERQRAESALRAESAALAQAHKQEEVATLEAAKQQSINQFLNDMLRRADLAREKGKNLTVREALDAAAQQLASAEEKLDPEVQAALHMTIGQTYWSLDVNAPDAEPHFRAATELRRRVHGDVHRSVLESALALAKVLRNTGRLDEAEAMFTLVLENRRALLGARSPYVAQTLSSLGILQRFQGRYTEAEASYREALEIYRENFGDDDNVADVLGNLAVLISAQDRNEEAEPLFRDAIRLQRQTLGSQHVGLANVAIPAAGTLWSNGHREEAIELMEEGLAVMAKLGLSEAAVVALAHETQAKWAVADGDDAAAEDHAHAAIAILEKVQNPQGNVQGRLISLRVLLAGVLTRREQTDEAMSLACEARELLERPGTPEALDLVRARLVLGALLLELHRFDEAEAVLLKAAEVARGLAGRYPSPALQELATAATASMVRLYDEWHAVEPGRGHDRAAESWRARLAAPDRST